MEDANQRSGRILTVDRGFEWTRLCRRVVAGVYDRLVPVVKVGVGQEGPVGASSVAAVDGSAGGLHSGDEGSPWGDPSRRAVGSGA